MKAKYAPTTAALAALALTSAAFVPAPAQLPPTNMGKYVHQPGDNQYSQQTQMERHGVPRPPVQAISRPAGGLPLTPAPPRPDVTLEPIAADEPIPPAGFPPLPDRLDLPVGNSGSWSKTAFGGGFGGGAGGAAPGLSGGGPGPINPTFHQHYGHVAPGAFLQQQKGPGYYKAIDPGLPAKGGGGSGYYKARTPGADQYTTSTQGGPPGMAPPAYTGASGKDLKALGREPKLNERQEGVSMPDAPTPVVVSQSTTQDLSLPEDDFSYRYGNRRRGPQFRTPPLIKGPLNSVGGLTGVRF